MNGSVYFVVDGKPGSEAQQIVFTWRADGRKQLIRIPMLTSPFWKGTVTTVRIDPVNASLSQHQGDPVRIENLRAAGNLCAGAIGPIGDAHAVSDQAQYWRHQDVDRQNPTWCGGRAIRDRKR